MIYSLYNSAMWIFTINLASLNHASIFIQERVATVMFIYDKIYTARWVRVGLIVFFHNTRMKSLSITTYVLLYHL